MSLRTSGAAALGVGLLAAIALSCAGAARDRWTPPPVSGIRVEQQPGAVPPGTLVANRLLDVRVFANRQDGYALAFIANGTYAARTVNGGRTWRIAGPVLHVAAAQGGSGVGQIGVLSPQAGGRSGSVAFAWGGVTPSEVVDFTTDGRHWWAARFPGLVMSVGNNGGAVFANVYGSLTRSGTTHTAVWAYSTRTGRRWTYQYTLPPG